MQQHDKVEAVIRTEPGNSAHFLINQIDQYRNNQILVLPIKLADSQYLTKHLSERLKTTLNKFNDLQNHTEDMQKELDSVKLQRDDFQIEIERIKSEN